MISSLTGLLTRLDTDRVHLQAGPITYELLVPAADLLELQSQVGREISFHTLFYIEGDASRGNLEPRLIGFLRLDDRRFFEQFTTVKGIGPRTALRALTLPVGQIAQAIESKDSRFLIELKGIGRRTAELIIAELAGKVARFATPSARPGAAQALSARPTWQEDAIAALVQLDVQRLEAERLADRAMAINPALKTSDALLREMLRMRTTRV
jgi:holliday junction DNA helicase RuvA